VSLLNTQCLLQCCLFVGVCKLQLCMRGLCGGFVQQTVC